ncbi:MAG: hypothetical protein GY699_11230 [Desulfobacteraceae bacterium]|nr:hypothetical protein [Desulfobacteraceae bacterium]
MKLSENNVDEAVEETIKSEILANQHKENLKIREALKKQEEWQGLLED